MKENEKMKNDIDDFYKNYTNNSNDNNMESNKDIKKKTKKGRKVLSTILVITLCFVIGASAATAGIGYFLSVNNVNVKQLLEQKESDVTGTTEAINTSNSGADEHKVNISNSGINSISDVAKKVIPSVVGIKVTYPVSGYSFFFNGNSDSTATGEGSGIVYSSDGYILTNNHVVAEAMSFNSNIILDKAKIEVYINGDEKAYKAKVIGRNETLDVALIKIEAINLVPAEFGDSDLVEIGQTAIAIGNPGGMQYMNSVTAGIISGINREIDNGYQQDNKRKLNLIQTDAAINPGNSGGPLVNTEGQVIGINSIKIADVKFEGLGFAIPINSVTVLVDELIAKGYNSTGTSNIGISIDTSYTKEVASSNNFPNGAYVSKVGQYSPADFAGIRVKDIITEFNGVTINGYEDLLSTKEKLEPGDTVSLKVYRIINEKGDYGYVDLTITLGETRE